MKTKKDAIAIILALLASAIGFNAFSNPMHEETATIKVYGNCSMCKNRIETALKVKGISKADWDVKSKMLTVTYDPHVVTLDEIHNKIAAVGHDTEKVMADDKTYKNLMGCCQYERKK